MNRRGYSPSWTAAEHQRLVELAGTMKPAEIAKELNRSYSAVRNRARVNGISLASSHPHKRWTYDETAYLFLNYERLTIPRMAEKLGRSFESVSQKCRDLDLDCKIYGYKNHNTKYSDEDVQLCRALYAEGMALSLIAEKLELPYNRVWDWVNGKGRKTA